MIKTLTTFRVNVDVDFIVRATCSGKLSKTNRGLHRRAQLHHQVRFVLLIDWQFLTYVRINEDILLCWNFFSIFRIEEIARKNVSNTIASKTNTRVQMQNK